MVYDDQNDLVIMGGNTTSDDFTPSQNPYGFIIAVDSSGNYAWGNYYLIDPNPVSDITGC